MEYNFFFVFSYFSLTKYWGWELGCIAYSGEESNWVTKDKKEWKGNNSSKYRRLRCHSLWALWTTQLSCPPGISECQLAQLKPYLQTLFPHTCVFGPLNYFLANLILFMPCGITASHDVWVGNRLYINRSRGRMYNTLMYN